jgi:hypothetical protein
MLCAEIKSSAAIEPVFRRQNGGRRVGSNSTFPSYENVHELFGRVTMSIVNSRSRARGSLPDRPDVCVCISIPHLLPIRSWELTSHVSAIIFIIFIEKNKF